LAQFQGRRGDPSSFDLLDQLLRAQHYRLAFWRTAPERINYRRFFDVAELVSMRVEEESMFETAHALVFDLVRQEKVDGLRIDHIDGLMDPEAYLSRLPDTYIVVEKILGHDEEIPDSWPVQGTTGYDFTGYINAWFVQPHGLEQLDTFYREITGSSATLSDVEYERKKYVMRELFTADMRRITARLEAIADEERHWRDLSPQHIGDALVEVTACMPVYRTYIRNFEISSQDQRALDRAIGEARRRNPDVSHLVYDLLQAVLTLQQPNENWLRFVMLWQQMTGPIMAKGVEDSSFYNYNRLVSLNEVGGIPEPVSTAEIHAFLAKRQKHTMNASSTHDTKRSEDVRARLNVLPELEKPWRRLVTKLIRRKPANVDTNTAYLLYQALVGAWPLKHDQIPGLRERLKEYMRKAAREARVHTNWLDSNEQYEAMLLDYVDTLLNDPQPFEALQEKVSFYGCVNSLSQLLIKAVAPGIPDFYRGTIEWDLSLVDPDNRRPVEFRELTDFGERAQDLLEHWEEG
jgi:(1->4)-alpha-D-glucan 1-alpha-D-glucosylmutase